MKRIILCGALIASLLISVTVSLAQGIEDVQKYPSCKYCGMDREKFAHTRMLIEYRDGSGFGSCSLHCIAVDLALNIDKDPKAIDFANLKMTPLGVF